MHLTNRAQIARTPRSTYTMPSGAFEACYACVRHPGSFTSSCSSQARVSDLTRFPVSFTAGCSWLILWGAPRDKGGRKLWRCLRGARLASLGISNRRPEWAVPLQQRVLTPRTCLAHRLARNHEHDVVRCLIGCKHAPSRPAVRRFTRLRLARFGLCLIGRLRAGAPHPVALWIATDRWIWRLRRLPRQALTRAATLKRGA
jgi:hypothetical protein